MCPFLGFEIKYENAYCLSFAILQRNLDFQQKEQQDIAAQKFLQLLSYSRTVLLQDMALLVDLQPHVPLWKDPAIQSILTHPKWAPFQEHVQLTHEHLSYDDIYDFTQVMLTQIIRLWSQCVLTF